MVQSIGTTAASAELTGTGTITGFSSAGTSGVLTAVVFCGGTEVSTGAFTMAGGGLTWALVGAYINGTLPTAALQSMFIFSAAFSSAVSSQTFTLTPHSPQSSHFGFILVELEGTKNTFEPGSFAISAQNSTSISIAASNTNLTSAGAAAGQPVVVVGQPAGFAPGDTVFLSQPTIPQSETLTVSSVAAGQLVMTTNLVNTYLNANGPTSVTLLCATTNANDIVLGCVIVENGAADAVVGAGGYTTAFTTAAFVANTAAAAGMVYLVVSSTSQTNNPQATSTAGTPIAMLAVAFEAATGASAQSIVVS